MYLWKSCLQQEDKISWPSHGSHESNVCFQYITPNSSGKIDHLFSLTYIYSISSLTRPLIIFNLYICLILIIFLWIVFLRRKVSERMKNREKHREGLIYWCRSHRPHHGCPAQSIKWKNLRKVQLRKDMSSFTKFYWSQKAFSANNRS